MKSVLNSAAALRFAALSAGIAAATFGVSLAEPNSASKDTSATAQQHARALDTIRSGEARKFRVELDGYVPPTSWLPQILGGRAVIEARVTPESYSIDSRVRAAGILDWFVDYSSTLNSRGRITSNGVTPVFYQALDDEGRKNRQTRITHEDDRVDVTVTPPHGNLGDPPATMEQKLEAMDPMSALMALSMNPDATIENPCQGVMRIFDGKGRYNLHLSLNQHLDKMDAPGWKGPAFVCNVRYEELAGYKKKTPEEIAAQKRDLKWVNIVLADLGPGEPRVPIKIEARSGKRGKITLVARNFSIETIDVDRAEIDDLSALKGG
ncbi:MAG: hypothetical protein CME88_05360 [Hirschia sp.]|nr:hypothetical protein [Hirschia sp.]MBF17792.1 hypothetical protein [Hirschia sp.]